MVEVVVIDSSVDVGGCDY